MSPHDDWIKSHTSESRQGGGHEAGCGSLSPLRGMEVEAKDLAATVLLSGLTVLRISDDMLILFGDQQAVEVEVAPGQYLAPHGPPDRDGMSKDLWLKEVDVGHFPCRGMGFSDVFSVSESRLTHRDETSGHLVILFPDVRERQASTALESVPDRRDGDIRESWQTGTSGRVDNPLWDFRIQPICVYADDDCMTAVGPRRR
jgi:hypothetical protein